MSPQPAGRAIDHDSVIRTFEIPSFDHLWPLRSLNSKARVVSSEAAQRLKGMTSLFYSLAAHQQVIRGQDADQYMFLAAATHDLAQVLTSLNALLKERDSAEDEATTKSEKKGRTRK